MKRRYRSNIVLGLLLLIIGGWFLVQQLYPGLRIWEDLSFSWPWFVMGTGAFLLLLGLLVGAPGLAVPATIVGGIGALLYWQNATGNWESWTYTWALIPGFVGLGIILSGLLEGKIRGALSGGGTLIIISVILFAIFSSILGGQNLLGPYWPVLLILLGIWIIVRTLLRPRNRKAG